MQIKADLHVHSLASWDGRSSLMQLAGEAKKRGLDAVAICDHDLCTDVSGEYPVLLLPCTEITTAEGHILGLCLASPLTLTKAPSAAQAVDAIHRSGGVAVLAHPYSPKKADDALLRSLAVDAVECENARVALKAPEKNALASRLAEQRGLARVGGSDGHSAEELGGCITLLSCAELSASAVREAILQKNCEAVFRHACTWRQKGLSQWAGHRRDPSLKKRLQAFLYLHGCILRDLFGRNAT